MQTEKAFFAIDQDRRFVRRHFYYSIQGILILRTDRHVWKHGRMNKLIWRDRFAPEKNHRPVNEGSRRAGNSAIMKASVVPNLNLQGNFYFYFYLSI